MANCTICDKPIILTPSAAERAEKHGGKPSDYTKLFTTHSKCFVEKRSEEARELMRVINGAKEMKSHPIKVELTDHELAKIVRDGDLKLTKQLGSNYYYTANFSIELLVIFDNSKSSRNVYATKETVKALDLKEVK